MNEQRIEKIRQRITDALNPQQLDLTDESHKHVGHAGAASGGGHFDALIVSEAFEGKRLLQRHRMVYEALGDMMEQEIHAFSMRCKVPGEA